MKCALIVLALCSLAYARLDSHIYWDPILRKYVQDQGPSVDVSLRKTINWEQPQINYSKWLGLNKQLSQLPYGLEREQLQKYEGIGEAYWRPQVSQYEQRYPSYYQGYPFYQGYPYYQGYSYQQVHQYPQNIYNLRQFWAPQWQGYY